MVAVVDVAAVVEVAEVAAAEVALAVADDGHPRSRVPFRR